jgi:hypothetical protein
MAAFQKAHSVTYRVLGGADHGLSEERWQRAYSTLLVGWMTEMVLGARSPGEHDQDETESKAAE